MPNADGASKRQPKETAEEDDRSGTVPTEESPKTDEADAKPSGTSKYFIPKIQQTKPSFWRLLLRVTVQSVRWLVSGLISPAGAGLLWEKNTVD